MANMVSVLFGLNPSVLLALHNRHSPSDAEWREYLACFEQGRARCGERLVGLRGLVITDGGAPGHLQRAQLNSLIGGQAGLAVVVSDAPLVRGVVNTLNLFNPRLRAFSPADFHRALSHIGVPQAQMSALRCELDAMNREVPTARTLRSLSAQFEGETPAPSSLST